MSCDHKPCLVCIGHNSKFSLFFITRNSPCLKVFAAFEHAGPQKGSRLGPHAVGGLFCLSALTARKSADLPLRMCRLALALVGIERGTQGGRAGAIPPVVPSRHREIFASDSDISLRFIPCRSVFLLRLLSSSRVLVPNILKN